MTVTSAAPIQEDLIQEELIQEELIQEDLIRDGSMMDAWPQTCSEDRPQDRPQDRPNDAKSALVLLRNSDTLELPPLKEPPQAPSAMARPHVGRKGAAPRRPST